MEIHTFLQENHGQKQNIINLALSNNELNENLALELAKYYGQEFFEMIEDMICVEISKSYAIFVSCEEEGNTFEMPPLQEVKIPRNLIDKHLEKEETNAYIILKYSYNDYVKIREANGSYDFEE